jgi:hypothetical protein
MCGYCPGNTRVDNVSPVGYVSCRWVSQVRKLGISRSSHMSILSFE